MKIKTPPSKSQLRLLKIIGITESPSNYVIAGELLLRKGWNSDAYVGAFGWRQINKWTDEEFLQNIKEYNEKKREEDDSHIDIY